MKVFRVSCDLYDWACLIRSKDAARAEEIARRYTEDLGWDSNLEDGEGAEFSAEQILLRANEVYEMEDL